VIARYEKFFFFLSLTLMILFFHFFYMSLNGLPYRFPAYVPVFLIIPFLPAFLSNPIYHLLKMIFMKIGHINSTVLYFIIYYFILTPVGVIRKNRCDLNFGDSKKQSFLIRRGKKEWDLERPY